jgi:hypothetical protein
MTGGVPLCDSNSSIALFSHVALDKDLNANLLRRWIGESKQTGKSQSPAFVPINSKV